MEKVFYQYWRKDAISGNLRPYTKSNPEFEADEHGGMTICTVVLQDGTVGTGAAWCDVRDCFVYATGRTLAWARATEDAIRGRLARLKR